MMGSMRSLTGITAMLAVTALGCAPAGMAAPAATAAPAAADPVAEQSIIQVARQASPAVVRVAGARGEGSGVIIQPDGIILTNAHVVGGAPVVEIGLADGRLLEGRVLGEDPGIDIAVIQVDAAGELPMAPIGDSDRLEVGQAAIAIGNPLGLDRTVTSGVVSAVNRSPRGLGLEGLIQTDAAINPGNSGGPLLDSAGRVIGINTVILQVPGAGLGFAVPINLASNVVQQLLTTGRVRHAYLGVAYDDVTRELAAQFRLPVAEGVIVLAVEGGSPADAAGLRPGDIITAVEGERVTHGGEFRGVLRARAPGDEITMQIMRPPGEETIRARLGEAPPPQ